VKSRVIPRECRRDLEVVAASPHTVAPRSGRPGARGFGCVVFNHPSPPCQRRLGPSSLKVTALRDGEKQDFEVVLDEFPEDSAIANYSGGGRSQRDDLFPEGSPLQGIKVMDSDSAPEEYRVPEDIKGAVVVGIDSDSKAAQSGLRVGDVILEVNRERVKSGREAVEAARGLEGRALLRVWSQGGTRFLVVGGNGPRR